MLNANVRTRIALWFVGLSTIVYIIPTILGGFLFYYSLTHALDLELRTLASSLGHAVDMRDGTPQFREWTRIVQTDPSRSLSTIQLYDNDGKLLQQYGAEGIRTLFLERKEVDQGDHHMRLVVTPLLLNGRCVGYLQIEVPTRERDAATKHFIWTMLMMAPAVLIGLGVCSYYVSDKATIPIQKTLQSLRQFIADAGHELNTPLSIINASNEALHRKLTNKGLTLKETDVIASSAERMQKIIDDLSLLAEIESPAKAAGTFAACDIRDVIEQELTEFSVKFEQKGLKLEHSAVPQCTILANKESLHVLFSNLLENALRYTDSGGQVVVDAQRDNGILRVMISDTGVGIPADSLPHIFDRFYRVDKSRSRASGGSGLGLAIARAIAQSHAGNIEVSSTYLKGSKFTVTLPLHSSTNGGSNPA